MGILLDKVRMHVIETSSKGVINTETIFIFSQTGDHVHAEYSGGPIAMGFLVGRLENDELNFSYCQMQDDGRLDAGTSCGRFSLGAGGKIRMVEQFEWKSRPGEMGINIFQEL